MNLNTRHDDTTFLFFSPLIGGSQPGRGHMSQVLLRQKHNCHYIYLYIYLSIYIYIYIYIYVYALVIRRTYYDCIHVLSHRSQVQSLNRDIIQPRWPWHCILRVEYKMALIAQLGLTCRQSAARRCTPMMIAAYSRPATGTRLHLGAFNDPWLHTSRGQCITTCDVFFLSLPESLTYSILSQPRRI